MRLHRLLFAPGLCLVAFCALAQTTPPPRDAAAASRAARDADNPMRMIIEASKLKVRIRPDPAPEAVAAPAEKRTLPPAPAAVPKPVPVVAKTVAPAPAPVPQAAAAEEPRAEVAAIPPPPPAPVVEKAAASPAAPAAALPLLPLKLTQLVEPSLPGSVLRRMRDDIEVVVGFTVNADGTVSNVAVRSSPMKSVDAAVVEAVAQWRYEPIREPRSHAVQLVLRANP
ncbi:TonB family protein [Sphaerotilaceae bacterium SBD11-9]